MWTIISCRGQSYESIHSLASLVPVNEKIIHQSNASAKSATHDHAQRCSSICDKATPDHLASGLQMRYILLLARIFSSPRNFIRFNLYATAGVECEGVSDVILLFCLVLACSNDLLPLGSQFPSKTNGQLRSRSQTSSCSNKSALSSKDRRNGLREYSDANPTRGGSHAEHLNDPTDLMITDTVLWRNQGHYAYLRQCGAVAEPLRFHSISRTEGHLICVIPHSKVGALD